MTRDKSMDFVKGVAIVCMVLAHAGLGGVAYRFIYLWHMPLFFLVAGWFFVPKSSWAEYGRFALVKVRRLWLPYVFWCALFVLVHNLFVDLGLYPDLSNAAIPAEWKALYSRWTAGEMLAGICASLNMLGGNFLIALPMWFLAALFYALLAYGALALVVGRLLEAKWQRECVLLTVTLGLTWFGRSCNWDLWVRLSNCFGWNTIVWQRLFTAVLLMYVGTLARSGWSAVRGLRIFLRIMFVIVGIGALGWLALGGVRYELCASQYPSVSLLVLTSVIGLYVLLTLADLGGLVVSGFAYVGRHTLAILIFHALIFRLVSRAYIVLKGLPADTIGTGLVAFGGGMWILVYTAAAVGFSLLLGEIWRRGSPLIWRFAGKMVYFRK